MNQKKLDLEEQFWSEFKQDPGSGYGPGVVADFVKRNWEGNRDGNGAAMQVQSVGLCFDDVSQVAESARVSANSITFDSDEINGAVLQAVTMHCALKDATKKETIRILKNLAQTFDSEEGKLTYVDQLEDVISMLEEPNHDFESGFELGNEALALKSVPTAIYSFLKARHPVEGLETANPFERTVQLALTFGGDSRSICSMAGALAGAFYGESGIPGLNRTLLSSFFFHLAFFWILGYSHGFDALPKNLP
jgi:poly(ADP-ribose) glycohydrolase ARH3